MYGEIIGHGGGSRKAESLYHVVQKHLILDDWVGLVGVMSSWVTRLTDQHPIRLITHLVLTNRALVVVGDQAGEDIIVQAYAEYQMGQDDFGLIPCYRVCVCSREAGLDMDQAPPLAYALYLYHHCDP